MRRSTLVASGVALALVAGVGAGAVVLHDGGGGAVAQRPTASPSPSPPPVLVAARGAAVPTSPGITTAVASALSDPHLGGDLVGTVVDVATGDVLFDRRSSASVPPASTAKLLTATAALAVLGPQARLTTRTMLADGDTVLLVGGGDPTLSGPKARTGYPGFARLTRLADLTAAALKRKGVAAVSVATDTSAYAGPATAPGWRPGYVGNGNVAPVTALEVDEGRVDPEHDPRVADPALAAGRAFAELLAARGITVTGAVSRSSAMQGDEALAGVDSPPVAALVERVLTESDNDLAEALARAVARKRGRPGSFADGAAAVTDAVRGLGVSTDGIRLVDGSGLSRADRVTPAALAGLLRLASSADHPELRPVVTGLPVAGFTGTLDDRYRSAPAKVAAGEVRAKTGTLDGVSSLAGLVADRDGRLLAFAFVAPRAPYYLTAEAALDRLAARLAECGCR